MSPKSPWRFGLAAIAAAVVATASLAQAGSAPPAARTFTVAVAGGKVKGSDTLKVKQGERVELHFTSDQPMVLHLHGYELQAKVEPPKPSVLAFKADLTGRFPVHQHREGAGSHRAVLFVEVYP